MRVPSANRFSAAAAQLGYAYQFRVALLAALHQLQTTGLTWKLSVETVDDLVVETEAGDRYEQLKHRAEGTTLTDGASDLWKTLRVWSEALREGTLDPQRTTLYLVTTADVSPGTACELLATDPAARDNSDIVTKLTQTAESSQSQTLSKAHSAFLSLDPEERIVLVQRTRILTSSPDIEAVGEQIRSVSRLSARDEHLDAFVERLEGWWNARCIGQLVHGYNDATTGHDFDSFVADLREQFHHDNLPIDSDVLTESPAIESFLDAAFCHQLSLIDVQKARIAIAVRDYHRAFVQRSRWSQDGLLAYGELDRYERNLKEAWEIGFERMREELGTEPAEDAMREAARGLYAWSESADFPIRPACTEGFVSRGTFHLLADRMEVGWHPDFELRLAELLEPEPAE